MQNNEDEEVQKRVAYYSSLVDAWIQTRMEVDKNLIVISSIGIGFLITLLTNKGVSCATALVVYLGSFFSFFATIILCIVILHRNSSYIQKLIISPEAKDTLLDHLDFAAKLIFALGLIFTLIIGVSTGINQLYSNNNIKGGQEMTEERSKKYVTKSLKDLAKGKSLSGLGALNPANNPNNTSSTKASENHSSDKEK